MTKLVTLIVALAVLGFLVWFFWPAPDPVKPPDRGAVEIPKRGNITIGSSETPALPEGYKPRSGDKIITIKATKDIPAGSEIKILVPKEDAPFVLGDSGKAVIGTDSSLVAVEYVEFKDSWLQPHILIGASADFKVGASPYVALTGLTIAETFHLGAGIDRFALGPAVHWEFWREFNLGVKWNLVPFTDCADVGLSISYRL